MHPVFARSSSAAFVAAFTLAAVGLPAQTTTYPALVYATVQVGGAPHDLLLDLVVPNGAGPRPLVVWVHGGGWSGGSRLPIPGQATRLLPLGYAVASIDYRLSGQAIWPAQIQDCKAAIRFLRANAATYGIDANRIGVMGSSAGGHLVAALATMGDAGVVHSGSYVADVEGTVGPFAGVSSRVQCAVDMFGPTGMLLANDFPTFDHDAAGSPESMLVGGALQANAEKWATVDPVSFLSPNDAPVLAMHGTDDTSVPFHMSELLVRAGTAIGHDVALFPVQDNGHGGPGFAAPAALAAIDAFLGRTLRDLPDVVVAIAASDPLANEGGDPAAFVVARSGGVAAPLDVALWLDGDVAGSVTDGDDGERMPLRVTIPAGQSSVSVPFVPRQDALVEGDEVAVLHLVPTGRYRIDHGAASATATLVDDDSPLGLPLLALLPLDPAASEGSADPGAVRCTRTGAVTLPLDVRYTIAGTAQNGADYALLSGVATIPAASANVLIVVHPLQDNAREPYETVVLRLAASADYALAADRTAHVIVSDDDRTSPLPTVAVIATDITVGEPAEAGAFTLTRTGGTAAPLVVPFAIGGTATPGADFAVVGGSATIAAGAAFVRVPIAALDDFAVEGPENVTLSILPGAGYVRAPAAQQELWITDDEAPTPAPAAVGLAMGQLAIGTTGTATIVGGGANGFAALWIAGAPGYLPFAPYGVVQIDIAQAGTFVAGLLDGSGAVTLPIALPPTTSLIGLPTWWQAIATTAAPPFLALSDGALRVVHGTPVF